MWFESIKTVQKDLHQASQEAINVFVATKEKLLAINSQIEQKTEANEEAINNLLHENSELNNTRKKNDNIISNINKIFDIM